MKIFITCKYTPCMTLNKRYFWVIIWLHINVITMWLCVHIFNIFQISILIHFQDNGNMRGRGKMLAWSTRKGELATFSLLLMFLNPPICWQHKVIPQKSPRYAFLFFFFFKIIILIKKHDYDSLTFIGWCF